MDLLKGLNAAQRAAVTSKASVLQVLAPPGSGKTKTLTTRVAYLLHNGYKPQHIICCTFTIKASREMRERLRGLVGGDLESKLVLGTFHSICRRYLLAYGHLIGLPKNFGIADSTDSLGIIKRLKKKLDFTLDPKTARNRISHRKARGETLELLQKGNKKSVDAQEFLSVFQEYENALATSNLLDYDDLLLKCVELLRKHPSCVSNVEALLIDEFQDTNVVQFELMKLLASAKSHITIVGDPDQSIYGFRSAEIANLKRMKDQYADTMVINLEENYRSSSAILNLAQAVIEQDEERPDKRLKSTHCYGTLPVLRKLYNPYDEAAWIVSEIKRVIRMTGGCVEYSDIAILLRSSFLSLLVEKALVNAAIPYKMVGGRRFFERVEVRLMLDYMRTVSHPQNNSALLAIINTPSRRIGEATIAELTGAADKVNISLWELVQRFAAGSISLGKNPSKATTQGLKDLVILIRKGQAKLKTFEAKDAPGKLIEFLVKEVKFLEYLKNSSELKEDWEDRWENIRELSIQAQDATLLPDQAEEALPEVEGLKQAQLDGPQEALSRFLANVALATEMQTEDEDVVKSRLTISTIHAAKGLEWPVVFIPAVYTGSIPHSRAEDTNEERRLLYVAMTRAKALLYMTFPVMQSRSESESVMTEFLPTSVNALMQNKGPAFSDKVVKDIALVLRRSEPSQEKLVQALTGLDSTESAEDDIWPEDGTQRQLSGFMDDRGKSCGYRSTLVDGVYISTVSDRPTSHAELSGFTTASDHLSRNLPALEVSHKAPRQTTKPSSGQGNIATFFARGTFKKEEQENMPPRDLTDRKPFSTLVTTNATPTSDIPPELRRIKLGGAFTPSLPGARRSSSTIQTSSTTVASVKRSYSCFSSSPTQEPAPDDESRNRMPHKNHITTMHSTSLSSLQQRKNYTTNTYASGMLNTLSRPTPLTMPSSSVGHAKKTLGVKRSMTGWNDRKHK